MPIGGTVGGMLARVRSAAVLGIDAYLVDVKTVSGTASRRSPFNVTP